LLILLRSFNVIVKEQKNNYELNNPEPTYFARNNTSGHAHDDEPLSTDHTTVASHNASGHAHGEDRHTSGGKPHVIDHLASE
jgi:hypothetical protein